MPKTLHVMLRVWLAALTWTAACPAQVCQCGSPTPYRPTADRAGPPASMAARGTIPVTFEVTDFDGSATYFRATLLDRATGEAFPHRGPGARRFPDLYFQSQIYRKTGDVLLVPPGDYTVLLGRGPEYMTQSLSYSVTAPVTIRHTLQRWVHPAARSYYSGDHHLHTAGCFIIPQVGEGTMRPEHLLAHVAGEGLNVGESLIWGAAFTTEAQWFSPRPDPVSLAEHIIKYDVEVSRFGAASQGHYCLMRLSEMHFPGTGGNPANWPSWHLPVLQWVKAQGGITGTMHSGTGLQTPSKLLPNYLIPPMNGIGAMSFFVDVTHDAVDFFATVCTDVISELNAWYHIQNCGYRTKISGGTDFPCMGGEKAAGQGRVYLKVGRQPGAQLSYDAWADALVAGKGYVSEGQSHLFDFAVNGHGVGEGGSEVLLREPGAVRVTCTAAALLPIPANPIGANTWRWNLEKARLANRQVPVEIVVNGLAVHRQLITADGSEAAIDQMVPINKSSWIAVRILHSSHTNSIYALVDGRPIRASRNSALWCDAATERYWQQLSPMIDPGERGAALTAYQSARATYQAIAAESSIGPFAATSAYGGGCAGTAGTPTIGKTGKPTIGNQLFELTLSGAAPGATPSLLLSQTKGALSISGCQLLLGAPIFVGPSAPAAGPAGSTRLPFPIPASATLEGAELHVQWLIPDSGGQLLGAYALSDALTVHISAQTRG